MIYLYAFLLAGTFCMIAQIIADNTKLTPGHITSMFAVVGAFLSFLGIYDKLISYCGGGATTLISNFGHSLYVGGLNGYYENGILGIFTGLLTRASAAIVACIIFSFVSIIFFKAKD